MNGTSVFCDACATVANCSALLNPSAATSIFAPVFSSGLSRCCSSGAVNDTVDVFGVNSVGELAFAAGAAAGRRGLAAGLGATGVAAGCGAADVAAGASCVLTWFHSVPVQTPMPNAQTMPAVMP